MFVDQPSQLFFMTGFKVDLLAFSHPITGFTDMHVLAEGCWPGRKTVNSVASLLLHHVTWDMYAARSHVLNLQSDNCSAQFKNHLFVAFLLYWAITAEDTGSENRVIRHHFTLSGHGKSMCDQAFGLLRRATKQHNILNAEKVCDIIPTVTDGLKATKCTSVTFYDWEKFLHQMFDFTILHLTKMHIYEYSAVTPGTVRYKKLPSDQWSQKNCFKPGVTVNHVRFPEKFGFRPLSSFKIPGFTISDERKGPLKKIFNQYESSFSDEANQYRF